MLTKLKDPNITLKFISKPQKEGTDKKITSSVKKKTIWIITWILSNCPENSSSLLLKFARESQLMQLRDEISKILKLYIKLHYCTEKKYLKH